MLAVLTGLVLLGSVTACSSEVSGSAGDSTPASSAGSAQVDPAAGPSVPRPLNIQPYLDERNVCLLLGKSEVNALGIAHPKAKPKKDSLGTVCAVTDSGADGVAEGNTLNYGPQPSFSPSDLYKKKGVWPYFVPGSVQGYSAVVGDSTDNRKNGGCGLGLAVTDKMVVNIWYNDDKTKNGDYACGMAKKAADEIVTTLKKTK
ncbi:DUF3558 domain-containing protein [Sciscionella sediminilitoris]|uniref:DUF3558 domain-containing protein n=1 Tax=Sciscionella sediminilitoris TaxID=1445613 RepID=UPI0004DF149F|nr:DUF3558 domain-containing protein [Sciscionella sp. SE31]